MQVWNVRHAARWKCRAQKSPSGHHRTTLSGYIFATKARIDNRKKLVKQQYVLQMFPQYGEPRPTNGLDRLAGLGNLIIFPWVLRLGSVTARQSSSGHQPNFAALNRGRHLCSAGRPSRWALAHILVLNLFCPLVSHWVYELLSSPLAGQLWANMMSSTKPEVDNILHCHQRRTETQPHLTYIENSVKFGHVVFDICKQTDTQACSLLYFTPLPGVM